MAVLTWILPPAAASHSHPLFFFFAFASSLSLLATSCPTYWRIDIVASPQATEKISHTLQKNTVRTHMPSYHARAHRGGLIIIRLPGRWWKNEQICQLPKETEDSSHFILSLSVYFILPLNPGDLRVGEGIYAGILSVIACVIVTMAKIMQA